MPSMKETIDFPVMRHDVSRYILRPSHDLIKSSEAVLDIYLNTDDEKLKKSLETVINHNQLTFLSDLEAALLFDQTNKDIESPMTISIKEWIKYAPSFNLHYMDIISHICRYSRSIHSNDLLSQYISKDTPLDDIYVLLKLSIRHFNFSVIAFIMDFIKDNYSEKLEDFRRFLSKTGSEQKNFDNLILSSHQSHGYAEKVLSYMYIEDFDFRMIVSLQNSRENNKGTNRRYETIRFDERFGALVNSGLFDNDEVIVKKLLDNIPEMDKNARHTISYIYHSFKFDFEKERFLELLKSKYI